MNAIDVLRCVRFSLLESRVNVREALELLLLNRGDELRIGGRQDWLLGSELGVKVVRLTLGLGLGLERWWDFEVSKLGPVDLAEECVLLDVLFAGRATAEALLGVASEELSNGSQRSYDSL